MRFTCPCCGYRTLPDRPGTLAALCEVCAWEGRDVEGRFRFTGSGLIAAQRAFVATGACDPALTELTRPPRPEEARADWWRPLAEQPAALIAQLEDAYAGVGLDGGVSMAEAHLIDEHALPSRTEHDRPPPGHGKGPPWQDLTVAYFERYAWGPFPFQDARGIRYYLPALLCADLRGEPPSALDSLVFILTEGDQLPAVHRMLTGAQKQSVARYLLYRAQMSSALRGRPARAALHAGWADYLDPEQLAQLPGE